jgi:hypothetical protein
MSPDDLKKHFKAHFDWKNQNRFTENNNIDGTTTITPPFFLKIINQQQLLNLFNERLEILTQKATVNNFAFVTLTIPQPINKSITYKDIIKQNKIYMSFIRKLKKFHNRHKIKCQYIAKKEFHRNGGIHIHIVLISSDLLKTLDFILKTYFDRAEIRIDKEFFYRLSNLLSWKYETNVYSITEKIKDSNLSRDVHVIDPTTYLSGSGVRFTDFGFDIKDQNDTQEKKKQLFQNVARYVAKYTADESGIELKTLNEYTAAAKKDNVKFKFRMYNFSKQSVNTKIYCRQYFKLTLSDLFYLLLPLAFAGFYSM